jgi:hypothetical protein
VRRNGRGAIQALQSQQMTAVVHDGNGHRPVVFEGFSLSGSGDGFDVRSLENVFGFHENLCELAKTLSIPTSNALTVLF